MGALPVGTELQDYILEQAIGRGDFCITYRAKEKLTGKAVTIREIFPKDYAYRNPEEGASVIIHKNFEFAYTHALKIYVEEATALMRVPYNPHIVQVLSVFEANNTAYVVMPHMDGKILSDCYKSPVTMPEHELRTFLHDMLRALTYIHAHGIVLRDIKTENILISPERKYVLTGFGTMPVDSSYADINTECYTPPEQMTRRRYNSPPKPNIDLYALGATCYRLITGYEPDYVPYRLEQDMNICGSYSSELLSSIDKAREFDPTVRWQSAQDWLANITGLPTLTEKQLAEIVATVKKLIDEEQYSDIPDILLPALGQNYAPAQFVMGECYEYGTGVECNDIQAEQWYRKAAEQNFAPAQNNLGKFYHYGFAVKKDPKLALYWYRKAAEQNHVNAFRHLSFLYDDGLKADDFEIEKDPNLATYWLRKAAELNDTHSQFQLGLRYYDGRKIEKDPQQAVYWLRKAAVKKNVFSQYYLGVCYENGTGVPKDIIQAVYWYRRAAANGFSVAGESLKRLGK